MMSTEQNNVSMPWRALDANIRDEAADEALQAESGNPVVVSGLPHFSSRPGDDLRGARKERWLSCNMYR